MKIYELLQRKRTIIEEASRLHDKTYRDGDGGWDDGDYERFNALCTEAEGLNVEINALVDAHFRGQRMGGFVVGNNPRPTIAVLRGRLKE